MVGHAREADGAEEDRVEGAQLVEAVLGHHRAHARVPLTAPVEGLPLEREAVFRGDGVEHGLAGGNNLVADAVARYDGDAMMSGHRGNIDLTTSAVRRRGVPVELVNDAMHHRCEECREADDEDEPRVERKERREYFAGGWLDVADLPHSAEQHAGVDEAVQPWLFAEPVITERSEHDGESDKHGDEQSVIHHPFQERSGRKRLVRLALVDQHHVACGWEGIGLLCGQMKRRMAGIRWRTKGYSQSTRRIGAPIR